MRNCSPTAPEYFGTIRNHFNPWTLTKNSDSPQKQAWQMATVEEEKEGLLAPITGRT